MKRTSQLKRSGFKKKPFKLKIKSKKKIIKVKKVKKEKLPTKTKLHEDLWKLFSKFIRERDKYICITCDKKTWPAQAGHYRTGATCKKYLFFDERNVNCQCYHCNINLSGNWRKYQVKMWSKYTEQIDHEFDVLNQKDGWDFPYEEKIKYYKNKLEANEN
jgi:hypothetical protein